MGSLSFRDRFYSKPVSRALTSPSAILSLGAGAAVGIVATAPVSAPLAVLGALAGGVIGVGVRLAVALPKAEPVDKIDPFTVAEPWRAPVIDAMKARTRFAQAVKTFRDGPLKANVMAVDSRLDDAVNECYRVAKRGEMVSGARRGINDREVAAELARAQAGTDGGTSAETRERRVASLQSQLESAARMDALIASTRDQLLLLNSRLDEAVTRAIELSVSNQSDGVGELGSDVDHIVDDLQTLRLAMEDVEGSGAASTDQPAQPESGR